MTTPQVIEKYEVITTLGRGSMGVVYKARDPEIGRLVAIKTLRSVFLGDDAAGNEALKRFRQESRSAGRLRHPNIVTIFETGRTNNGSPYIAMEYIEGESLEHVISERGPLEPREALHYLAQVASAIDYAHSQNVIHRDIKPSNVIVDGDCRPHLLDFGVAKLSDTSLTPAGTVVGTPSYMSPEQIRGESLDGATDLFSFAVVAFEIFTGHRPFPGKDFTTVVNNIIHKDPLTFSDIGITLPSAVEAAFTRALAKDKKDRYQNCLEFIDNIARAFSIVIDGTGVIGGFKKAEVAPTPVVDVDATMFCVPVRLGEEEEAAEEVSKAVNLSEDNSDPNISVSVNLGSPAESTVDDVKPVHINGKAAEQFEPLVPESIATTSDDVPVNVQVPTPEIAVVPETPVKEVNAKDERLAPPVKSKRVNSNSAGLLFVLLVGVFAVGLGSVVYSLLGSREEEGSGEYEYADSEAEVSGVVETADTEKTVMAPSDSATQTPLSDLSSAGGVVEDPVKQQQNPASAAMALSSSAGPEHAKLGGDNGDTGAISAILSENRLASKGTAEVGAVNARSVELVLKLTALTGDADSLKSAIEQAKEINDPAISQALISLMNHQNSLIRVDVLKALSSNMHKDRIEVRAAIRGAITDSDYLVRGFAAKIIGTIRDEGARSMLESQLARETNETVKKVIRGSLESLSIKGSTS